MRHYCTLFDSESQDRGLALHQSLVRHGGEFDLVILALDEATGRELHARRLPQAKVVNLEALTSAYPALAAARGDRDWQEFRATCKPWLLRHLLPAVPSDQWLTFLDADQYFLGSPEPVFEAIGQNASIAILPYHYAPGLEHLATSGRYDSGWVSLKHDSIGMQCAADWAEQCAHWCFRVLEPTRFLDQKYLDAWPGRYPGTAVANLRSAGAGPWRLPGGQLELTESGLKIGDEIFCAYHFSGLTRLGNALYEANLHRYDLEPTPELRELIYLPYLRILQGGTHQDSFT
ncbi:MAG: hypothetical protein ACHQ5A_00920, partial [Opitutales bacterium]